MKLNFKRIGGVILLIAATFLLTSETARAATLTVTAIGDGTTIGAPGCEDGCILREAIDTAAPGDRIEFASPLFDSPQTITLVNEFKIEKNLTIAGKGADLLIIKRGAYGVYRIFWILGTSVNLSGMTITNGNVAGSFGGGVLNHNSTSTITNCHITGNVATTGGGVENLGGTLTITGSTISNNTSLSQSFGSGGIHNQGTLHLINSTVSGNVKSPGNQEGGGIFSIGTVTITNSTITNNQVSGSNSANGVYADIGTVTIRNSIIAGSRDNASVPDVSRTVGNTPGTTGTFVSEGYNVIGSVGAVTAFNQIGDQIGNSTTPLDPRIDALGLYGGATPTHRLQRTPVLSPAIDKGKAFGAATDQRGKQRTSDDPFTPNQTNGDGTDIGAFELVFELTVTKIEDTNDGACNTDCSLREALAVARTGNEIVFSSLFDSPQIITLANAPGFRDLVINKNLTITGKGAHLLTIRRAAGAFRIITVEHNLTSVNLSGLTIENGFLPDNGGGILNGHSTTTITACHITGNTAQTGGGIYNELDGTLIISDSTISNNISNGSNDGGGGIHNRGTLTLINSTVSGNVKNFGNSNGGGIWTSGAATVTNSTDAENEAVGTNSAGGINRTRETTIVRNSIVAANRNNYEMPDVVGMFQSGGYNLIGNPGATTAFNQNGDQVGSTEEVDPEPLDPVLYGLDLNGGTTPTHALHGSSSAIDKGKAFGATTDQRGLQRPVHRPNLPPAIGGDHSDIGAFEAQAIPNAAPQPYSSPNPLTTNENTPVQIKLSADDANADTLTFTITDQPDNGTIGGFDPTPDCGIDGNYSYCDEDIVYTPNPGFFGTDSFRFKASDGQLDSEIHTVNITVQDFFQVLTVTKAADTSDGVCDADCSLREAIVAADAGDEIVFASPLFDSPQTITLSEAEGFRQLTIAKNLTITGKGSNLLTVRHAPDAEVYFSIFSIENNLNVSLSGMKITGAKAISGSAIFNGSAGATSGSLTVSNCDITGNYALYTGAGITSFSPHASVSLQNTTISNNTADGINIFFGNTPSGGGLHINGALTVVNSTISGNVKNNSESKGGGGIYSDGGNTVDITSSTVTDNQAVGSSIASGVFKNNGAANVRNTIIAGNRSNTTAADVAVGDGGVFVSSGYNLIGNPGAVTAFSQTGDQTGNSQTPLDPRLDPLANYGGETPTHRLQVSPVHSPAVDKGKAFGLTVDQRGQARPFDNNQISSATGGDETDIGAYEESAGFPLYVTKTADTNDGVCDADCSLREAIAAAAPGDTIAFASPLFDSPQTITLSDAEGFRELGINKSLTIAGGGAQLLTVRRAPDGAANFRIFNIFGGAVVNLSGMTITGGNAGGEPGGGIRNIEGGQLVVTNSHITGNNASYGGGIFNDNSGIVTLLGSTVSGNTADCVCGGGAGINNDGILTLTNSTVSGNVKTNGDGNAAGGIYNYGGEAIFTNSTITDNKAPGTNSASGIFRAGGTVTVRSTIIAGNRSNSTEADVMGEFASNGYNLIGNAGSASGFNKTGDLTGSPNAMINPKLTVLGNYGGTTPTHKLMTGSPAVDAGNSFGSVTDQLGSVRPLDIANITNASDASDIGAYELQAAQTFSISGTIVYGTTPTGQATKFVRNVMLSATGANNVSALTNAGGVYSLNDLIEGGNYTVTPTKSGNLNGITPFDATLVLRCVAAGTANCALNANQKQAANANGSVDSDSNPTITPFDATLILRYVAGNVQSSATGQVGNWKFLPDSRNYPSLSATLAEQDYTGILIGDVNGNWTPPNNLADEENRASADETVSVNNKAESNAAGKADSDFEIELLANAPAIRGTVISIPVVFRNRSGKSISGFGFVVRYDPAVLEPITETPFETGVSSDQNNFSIVAETAKPGRIGIAASATNSIFGASGTLLNLRFAVAGAPNSEIGETRLTFERNGFREAIVEDAEGSFVSVAATGASLIVGVGSSKSTVTLVGRIETQYGRGLRNVQVTLTDSFGRQQTILSGASGRYEFADVAIGQTVTIQVVSKRFSFAPQTITVTAENRELNFAASPD